MTDYSKTKIYIIRSNNTDRVYVGATTQPLSHRFRDHNNTFRKGKNGTRAVEVLKHGDCYIELLESFPCDNVDESSARERHWGRQFDGQKVNKNVPGRTVREWYQNNIERQRERAKLYAQNNKYHRHQKFDCPCGGRYRRSDRSTHFKSLKHKAYLIGEWSKHNIFNHL